MTTTCSGINYLEGLLEDYREASRMICVSDVCDESLRQVGGDEFRGMFDLLT